MFVGEKSVIALLRYEVLTCVLGPLPGALGYFLRSKCYRWILDQVGRGCLFGRGVVIRSPRQISVGEGVMIDDGVVLDAKGSTSRIILGDQILLGRQSIFSCNEAQISIGSFVSIGPFCFFACKSRIEVGSNVSIGSGAQLMAGGHVAADPDVPVIHQARIAKGITIEDGAWVGTGAIILDGVTVGRNSIVGAGAVVSKDVPPWTVVLGNPARVVQKRKMAAQQ
jgi:acetyltransferase-like isoleucine patch superfamily enzyme